MIRKKSAGPDPQARTDAMKTLCRLFAPWDETLFAEVRPSLEAPAAYVAEHAARLAQRNIQGPVPSLPWIALVDALQARGNLGVFHWKDSPAEVMAVVDGLLAARPLEPGFWSCELVEAREPERWSRSGWRHAASQAYLGAIWGWVKPGDRKIDASEFLAEAATRFLHAQIAIVTVDINSDSYEVALLRNEDLTEAKELAAVIGDGAILCRARVSSTARAPGPGLGSSRRVVKRRIKDSEKRALTELVERGDAKRLEGNQRSAIEDYTKALAIDGESVEALGARGISRSLLDQNAAAVLDLDGALQLDRLDTRYHGVLYAKRADCRVALGDFAGSLADNSSAIAAGLAIASTFASRASTRYRLADDAGALRDCEKALVLDPKNERALFVRGLVKARRGDLSAARKDMSRAALLDSVDAKKWLKSSADTA